jgi:hypothetical protein
MNELTMLELLSILLLCLLNKLLLHIFRLLNLKILKTLISKGKNGSRCIILKNCESFDDMLRDTNVRQKQHL